MNSYEKIYNLLTEGRTTGGDVANMKKHTTRVDRKETQARLGNKEAGSMLSRPNQRRLTRLKALIKGALER